MLKCEQLEPRIVLDACCEWIWPTEVLDYEPGRGVGINGSADYSDPSRALGSDFDTFVSLGEGGWIALGFAESAKVSPRTDYVMRVWEAGASDCASVHFSDDYGETWYNFGTRFCRDDALIHYWDADNIFKGRPERNWEGFIDLDYINAVKFIDDGSLNPDTNVHAGFDLEAVRINVFTPDGSDAGDANMDGVFNTIDIGLVALANKYNTGKLATWEQGDWNGDRVFDSLDLVAALRFNTYTNYTAEQLHRAPVGQEAFDLLAACHADTDCVVDSIFATSV